MTLDPGLLLFAAPGLAVAATALLIDRVLGYPNGLQDWIGHPVEWIGQIIAAIDAATNEGVSRRMKGAVALFVAVALTAAITVPLALWLRSLESGWIAEALLASTLLSQKSLEDHVRAVASGLRQSLAKGREAVAQIVGRDARKLDSSDVAKGAVESLAENFSDGTVAPLFWLLVAGLPGIAIYKTVNTADSMIGYRNKKYEEFGWASARTDDLLNLLPARLSGWLIVAVAALLPRISGKKALSVMARDARKHASPNAGWPEAAMAGAIGVRLGGPRSHDGKKIDLPWMGDGKAELSEADIEQGLRLYNAALNLLTGLVVIACAVSWAI